MTERIYYTDAYCREFRAVVDNSYRLGERPVVELSASCFYPESGGQPPDRGELNGIPVVDVQEKANKILHFLEKDALRAGTGIIGRIDWVRRFDHMQQHTGQHLLSQAFLRLMGAHTEAFHLGSEISSIDLSCEALTRDQIYEAEDLVNRVVFEDREIQILFVSPEEQQALPLRKQSGRSGRIRLIDITDFDCSPCGGTHCRKTGEVGLVKLRKWERVNKRARVEFLCGWRALRDYRWKNRALYRLSRIYSTADKEVVEAAEKLRETEKALRKDVAVLQDALICCEADRLNRESRQVKGIRVVSSVWEEGELRYLQKLANRVVESLDKCVVLFAVRGPKPALFFVRSPDLSSLDMRDWIHQIAPLIGGRGGGLADRAQAGGTRADNLEEALEAAVALL